MPAGGHQHCGCTQAGSVPLGVFPRRMLGLHARQGTDKNAVPRPHSTPLWHPTAQRPPRHCRGPHCPAKGFRWEALGQGDRDAARADVTEPAGVRPHAVLAALPAQASLWQPAARRCDLPAKTAQLGEGPGEGPEQPSATARARLCSAGPGPKGCPPSVSPRAASAKPRVPGSQAEPGRKREPRQQSQP